MKSIVFLCAALLLGAASLVEAQPGGGGGRGQGRRGGMGMGLGLESEWAIICFELKVEGEQFAALRAVYQEAWGKRRDLMAQMRDAGADWEEMGAQLQKFQEELAGKYSAILSKEQVARLQNLVEERRGGFGGGRGGPGGGGGR
jgi:hypothetical protein